MKNIKFYECVTSTNDLLKEKALNGAKDGTVIAALSQTNGRGRRGKTFISDKGGMYLSILVRPTFIDFDTTLLTSMTAVAVCKAIETVTNKNTEIKWVNDVIIGGKKVCGILCESCLCGEDYFVIVGIGLNYFCENFQKEIENIATNIFDIKDEIKEKELTKKIIDNFFEIYNSGEFFEDYKKRSVVIGKQITFYKNEKQISATVLDIDEKCRLLVEYSDKSREFLSSGEISIKLKEL